MSRVKRELDGEVDNYLDASNDDEDDFLDYLKTLSPIAAAYTAMMMERGEGYSKERMLNALETEL